MGRFDRYKEASDREVKRGDDERFKNLSLRLNESAWYALREIAFTNECTKHDLLVEAVNLLFNKYGYAEQARRPEGVRADQRRRASERQSG